GTVVLALTPAGDLAAQTSTGADGEFHLTDLNRAPYRVYLAPPAPYRPQAFGTRSDPDPMSGAVIDLDHDGDEQYDGDHIGYSIVAVCDPGRYGPRAYLADLDLSGVDLRGCNLTGADLTRSTLTGANLDGADLTGANLTDVASGGIDSRPTLSLT